MHEAGYVSLIARKLPVVSVLAITSPERDGAIHLMAVIIILLMAVVIPILCLQLEVSLKQRCE